MVGVAWGRYSIKHCNELALAMGSVGCMLLPLLKRIEER